MAAGRRGREVMREGGGLDATGLTAGGRVEPRCGGGGGLEDSGATARGFAAGRGMVLGAGCEAGRGTADREEVGPERPARENSTSGMSGPWFTMAARDD